MSMQHFNSFYRVALFVFFPCKQGEQHAHTGSNP